MKTNKTKTKKRYVTNGKKFSIKKKEEERLLFTILLSSLYLLFFLPLTKREENIHQLCVALHKI